MIFWTVVFIVYYLACLLRGNLFYDALKKSGELILKQSFIEDKQEKEKLGNEILKSSWMIFLIIPLSIVMLIYLFKAITIDPYKYPSIVMLFYVLLKTFIFRDKDNNQKKDLTTEEGRIRYKIQLEKIKRYSFSRFLSQLIYLSYFTYMFYILVLIR